MKYFNNILIGLIVIFTSCKSQISSQEETKNNPIEEDTLAFYTPMDYWMINLDNCTLFTQSGINAFAIGDTIDVLEQITWNETDSLESRTWLMAVHQKRGNLDSLLYAGVKSYIIKAKKESSNGLSNEE